MSKAMLIDLTKCTGCRGCQVACKQWYNLPAETTHNRGSYQNPPQTSGKTRTIVTFNEVEYEGKFAWIFAKRQCMHCEHPACVSACTVGALQKTAEGPVVYDASKCIGCRYCQYACPFNVPRFEWEEVLGLITKCDMCVDRQAEGMVPACTKACPTGAISFGDRQELIQEGKRRIALNPDKYVDHIYGEREVGGTSVLYLAAIPFSVIGFPDVGMQEIPHYAEAVMRQTPAIALGMAAAASGLFWILKRRQENMAPVPVEKEEVEG